MDPSEPIRYTLTLVPSSIVASHLLSVAPNVTSSLSRRMRTSPLAMGKGTKSFDWAGIRISKGETAVQKQTGTEGERWRWTGHVTVPPNQASVQAVGVGVRVRSCAPHLPSMSLV